METFDGVQAAEEGRGYERIKADRIDDVFQPNVLKAEEPGVGRPGGNSGF